jgi:FkbM family methyltransferase
MAFNNCDDKTNGELLFWNTNKKDFKVVFDVGCRVDSLFSNFEGEVHYFDPVEEFINQLKTTTQNTKSFFNVFGLSDKIEEIDYFPGCQSFLNRTLSCKRDFSENKHVLKVQKAIDYINENNITQIDFLKIDTEGYELNVLKGFEDKLSIVKVIQFEYGGTYIDAKIKLIDVINYLRQFGFYNFCYLTQEGPQLISDFNDHYQYCNIVCLK